MALYTVLHPYKFGSVDSGGTIELTEQEANDCLGWQIELAVQGGGDSGGDNGGEEGGEEESSDDLTALTGLGETTQAALYAAGYTTYALLHDACVNDQASLLSISSVTVLKIGTWSAELVIILDL